MNDILSYKSLMKNKIKFRFIICNMNHQNTKCTKTSIFFSVSFFPFCLCEFTLISELLTVLATL